MKPTNPYIRAAATRPELVEEAVIKLQEREAPELIRARDSQGRFLADDPATPEDEAWTVGKLRAAP